MNRKLRIVLLVFFDVMATWFIIPVVFSGIVNIGNITGIVLFESLFLLTYFSDRVLNSIRKIRSKKAY